MSTGFFSLLRFCLSLVVALSQATIDEVDFQSSLPKDRPHIVLIVLDDLGSNDLGFHGSGIYTPFLDQLVLNSSRSLYLDNYYVLPYCSATRAALLSGRYPLHTGAHDIILDDSTHGLPIDETTLAQVLSSPSVKYETHAVGKWHVGHAHWSQTPTFRGFTSFYGFYHGHQDYFSHRKASPPATATTPNANQEPYEMHWDSRPFCGPQCSQTVDETGNYSTHVFTRRAIEIIQSYSELHSSSQQQEEPLFLYLAHAAVHWPDQVPDYYRKYYDDSDIPAARNWTDQRRTYAAMLTAADQSIRNVTEALQRQNLWENTLLIVTTDNGGPTDVCMVQGSSNEGRRGGKCTLYDGGTRGDSIVGGPFWERQQRRRRRGMASYSGLFHVVDWFQTLAVIAGVPQPTRTQKPLDSVNHWDCLVGGPCRPPRNETYIGYARMPTPVGARPYWYGPALRWKDWKLIQGTSGGPENRNGVYPWAPDAPAAGGNTSSSYLLYHLGKDPEERTNVADRYPEVVQYLQQKLREYHKGFVGPPPESCDKPAVPHVLPHFGPTWLPWCEDSVELRVY